MGSMYEAFRSDADAEKNGIILDYGTFRVTIARAGGANKKYQRTLEALSRPYRRAIQMEQMSDEQARELLKVVYARTIVRNWEVKVDKEKWEVGIESPDGETIPFNEENILLTFSNLPDLFADIMDQAGKAALFRASLREQAAGN